MREGKKNHIYSEKVIIAINHRIYMKKKRNEDLKYESEN